MVGVLVPRDVKVHTMLLEQVSVGNAHFGVTSVGRILQPSSMPEDDDPPFLHDPFRYFPFPECTWCSMRSVNHCFASVLPCMIETLFLKSHWPPHAAHHQLHLCFDETHQMQSSNGFR